MIAQSQKRLPDQVKRRQVLKPVVQVRELLCHGAGVRVVPCHLAAGDDNGIGHHPEAGESSLPVGKASDFQRVMAPVEKAAGLHATS